MPIFLFFFAKQIDKKANDCGKTFRNSDNIKTHIISPHCYIICVFLFYMLFYNSKLASASLILT